MYTKPDRDTTHWTKKMTTVLDIVRWRTLRDFVKLKNQKIREKLGSGWVGQAPSRIFIFLFCVFVLFVFPNV